MKKYSFCIANPHMSQLLLHSWSKISGTHELKRKVLCQLTVYERFHPYSDDSKGGWHLLVLHISLFNKLILDTEKYSRPISGLTQYDKAMIQSPPKSSTYEYMTLWNKNLDINHSTKEMKIKSTSIYYLIHCQEQKITNLLKAILRHCWYKM